MDDKALKRHIVELVDKGSRRGVYAWDLPSRLQMPLADVERAINELIEAKKLRWVVRQYPNFLLIDETSSGEDQTKQLALGG